MHLVETTDFCVCYEHFREGHTVKHLETDVLQLFHFKVLYELGMTLMEAKLATNTSFCAEKVHALGIINVDSEGRSR